ncbi:MAG: 23S rRNA (uracil(1939)-C(5))-methyltransferase RlmD [Deltaproteobacteria bacterium]|nr:23S rRNA (uracil(1939)-C(5))-methyltransferase RlmD [Deltaproteobacteria bacterium]
MREELVTIETLTFGGAGLGRIDGKVCFVPFTAVGDTVRVRIVTEKKSYLEGEVLECLVPSPQRIAPPCPVFGQCGGCSWQHLPYDLQSRTKEAIFAEILMRATRIERDKVLPILAAPEPYNYRSRVQFKVSCEGGKLSLGFYRKGTHEVIDIPCGCAIANEQVNRIFQQLRTSMPTFPEPDKVPQIDVVTGGVGDATVLFHYAGNRQDEVFEWLRQETPGRLPVSGVFLQRGRKAAIRKVWGDERLSYTFSRGPDPEFPEMSLSFRCGGFSQVNYRQNTVLIETALRWAGLKGTERVLDLFCGNGNFSLPLARYCSEVVGYEDFARSLDDAIENARRNGLANIRFFRQDSARGVRELVQRGECFDVVLLDPPRTGALDTVKLLPQLKPERIIYVSCDPATLARDLASLQNSGYGIISSCAVDMFPQTYHIESITILQKK